MSADPLRSLQAAARVAAEHLAPGVVPRRVMVLDDNDAFICGAYVPCCAAPSGAGNAAPDPATAPPEAPSGWAVAGRTVTFDGTPVPVRGRKLDVLIFLIEHDPAPVDELRAAWGGYPVEEGTIRWTVGELRKALKALFAEFPGELIEGSGEGYRLALQ